MDYKAAIENAYERIAVGDLEPLFDMLDPKTQWFEAENIPYSSDGPLVGRDAVQTSVFEAMAKDFDDFHVNISRVVATGQTVLLQGRYVGKTKANVPLDAIFAHVYDFEEDMVVRFQQYSDTWQWHEVLGALA